MNGKRGETPPLPRNCKRLLTSAINHCPFGWEGAGKLMCVASQETGPLSLSWSPLPRAKEDAMHAVGRVSRRGLVLLLLCLSLGGSALASSLAILHGRVL